VKYRIQFHPQSEVIFGHKLSVRTFNALVNYGNITTKDQLLKSYIEGSLFKIRNFGSVSYNEIFDLLDKEIQSNVKPLRLKDPKPIKPLSNEEKNRRTTVKLANEIRDLSLQIRQIELSMNQWAKATHSIYNIITHVGTERKYNTPNNV
tara:strand:+ start:81 stop:527 length:447 start_codon:yes stop_codon:yes gene_type:complete